MSTLTARTRYRASLAVATLGIVLANAHLERFLGIDCPVVDPFRYFVGGCVGDLFQAKNYPFIIAGFTFFTQPLLSVILTTSNIVRVVMMTIYVVFVFCIAPPGARLPKFDSMWGFGYGWGMICLFVAPNIVFLIIRLSLFLQRRNRPVPQSHAPENTA